MFYLAIILNLHVDKTKTITLKNQHHYATNSTIEFDT